MNQISSMNNLIQKINEISSDIKNNNEDLEVKSNVNFSSFLMNALEHVNQSQQESEGLKTRFALNDPKVSLEEVKIVEQKASIEFEMMMGVRNKLVNLYQKISQMEF